MEEARAERDELAVAERVRHRMAEQLDLAADRAVKAADTTVFTVPNRLRVAWCVTQLTAVQAITTEVNARAPAA